ncbi:MAG TPA: flagellar export protein FliJ [Spirochaetota bacterium]|jgi:flagellar protein FliJ|nr:flagellar export protein FliJ [Spirochaetota bacterium]HPS87253.1 flagellar export protein FliJ [Spirochaetota bacterium]
MKKFRFTLQRLLDIREARETEIKNELMKVLSLQNKERILQEELRSKISRYEIQYSERIKKGFFSAEEVMSMMRYTDVARKAIIEAERRIEDLQPEVDRIRERLVAASREKKIVEKLKERKFEEYEYEFNREMSKENDDMNQKLYHKKIM